MFWAINSIIIGLQKPTIRQNDRLNLTNLIFFSIFSIKWPETPLKWPYVSRKFKWTPSMYLEIFYISTFWLRFNREVLKSYYVLEVIHHFTVLAAKQPKKTRCQDPYGIWSFWKKHSLIHTCINSTNVTTRKIPSQYILDIHVQNFC